MDREELIKKWLDNHLNSEEQIAFEQLEDYKDLMQLDGALKSFKAPEFAMDTNFNELQNNLQSKTQKSFNWLKPLLRIAAIIAISLSVYFYTTTQDSSITTKIAQTTVLELPDASGVNLNANSNLSFNESKWEHNRAVYLNGEAFFKVAKGEKFDVITDSGIISVLGTEFNIKQRENYFEVVCYEGLVAVTHQNETTKLKPGDKFEVIDGKLNAKKKENATQPLWLRGESSFKNTAFKHIINELENQYHISIEAKNIDTSRLFTGSFTHNNLDLALKSVTIPLNLSYSKSSNTINLYRE